MRFGWILPVLILFGLLLAPNAAAVAASDAALLWWTRVLPSLLPYLITATLLERSGLFSRLPKRIAPMMLWLFGALGGYPVGAKLCAGLMNSGMLSERDARRAAPLVNLPNPVFLISVVAFGIFQSGRVLVPLLLGVYGAAAIGLVPLFRIRFNHGSNGTVRLTANDLPQAIETGVHAILVIGGCMLFASVLGALIEASGVLRVFGAWRETAHAILLGLFEMTCGVRTVSALSLPLAARLGLCAFLIQFGGGSVLLQSAAQGSVSIPRYALIKALLALFSGVITGLLTPLFCPDITVPTIASRAEMIENSWTILSALLSCAVGLLSIFVLTFGLHAKKAR